MENGRVVGLRIAGGELRARRGVVLAAGGFPHDVARKAAMFAHAPTGREHFSAAPESNTGDGLALGEAAGGRVRDDLANSGAWAPVSLPPRGDGGFGRFPHLVERAKPGLIMVTPAGRRFANEADSYHDVMQGLFAAIPKGEPVAAWMICDESFRRRYGLGRVRPFPFPVAPWLNNGYLKRGKTIGELARQCGVDGAQLEATVRAFNIGRLARARRRVPSRRERYNRDPGRARATAEPLRRADRTCAIYAVQASRRQPGHVRRIEDRRIRPRA